MSTFLQDLRFAMRTLRHSPGFSLVAISTLALGVGATSVVFSWILMLVAAANPAPDMSRLAGVWSHNRTQGETKNVVSPEDFVEWRRRQRSFDRFAGLREGAVNLGGGHEPVRASAQFVTADYFDVLDRAPVLGRPFRPDEETAGAAPVVILSHRFWRERFAASANAIGRTVQVDGRATTIVGVLPPNNFSSQLILPLTLDASSSAHTTRSLFVFARLSPEVSLEQARSEMAAIGVDLQRERPETHRGWDINTRPLSEEFIAPQARIIFALLFGAAAAVLLIGCANVANLLLARGVSRARELAVRTALGASRGRLVRQMLSESFVLAVFGAIAGLLLAHWGLALMRAAFGEASRALMEDVVVNRAVVAFAAAAALCATFVFGTLPALQCARTDVTPDLRDGARGTVGRRTHRLRASLVTAEVTMAVLFLVVSLLSTRSLGAILRIEPGFDTTNLLTLRVSLPDTRYRLDASVNAYFGQALERLRAMPRVIAAGAAVRMPAAGSRWNANRSMAIEGRPPIPGETLFAADLTVTPGYLETLRFPLRAGRSLHAGDGANAPLAVVVSEMTVRRYFSGSISNALGARIRLGDEPSPSAWRTIVGVVGDVRNDDIDAPPLPMVYVPLAQRASRDMTIVLRTSGDPMDHVAAARAALATVDPEQPVYDVKSMEQILDEDVRQSVVLIGIFGVFTSIALALAGLGIYGVIAHAVAQRTHEIGVRMALGAAVGDVIGLVVRQGLAPVLAGLALGLVGGMGAARSMRSVLYGVTPADPATYASVIAVLAGVATLACVLPARRAARVDPLRAIRGD